MKQIDIPSVDLPRAVETDGAWMLDRLTKAEVTVPESAVFTGDFSPLYGMTGIIHKREEVIRACLRETPAFCEQERAAELCAYSGVADLSHTAPDWKDILRLGLGGLLDRLRSASSRDKHTSEQAEWFRVTEAVWEAAIGYVGRMAEEAERVGKPQMAAGLRALCRRPPETLYEAMQLILTYYEFQQTLEGTPVRTLGRLDALFAPYLENDLAAGRLTEVSAKGMIDAFLRACDEKRVPANLPFALGGTDADGRSSVCRMSEWILERYTALALPNVKLHILYAPSLPRAWVAQALRGVRSGANSMVFVNDAGIKSALQGLGIAPEDAGDYTLVGCYEPCAAGEMPFSCSGRINLLQALEATLFRGENLASGEKIGADTPDDFPDFDAFFEAYLMQLRHFCRKDIASILVWERYLPVLHSAPFLSATFRACVEKGGDVYASHTAKYNDSSINLLGLASTVDALAAIRKSIFEDRTLTLPRLREILRSDWQGEEPLRRRIVRCYPKYGTAEPTCDALAQTILRVAAGEINGKPNERGGVFRMGGFSIDWCEAWGNATGASADGRHAGEWLSKNLCATIGADRDGITATLLSVGSLGGDLLPNGAVFDATLHPSAVAGEDGLIALEGTLKVYMELGGTAIQYNVMDADILRRAKAHPEEYPNLQVRLCGWNVLFSTLSDEEKNAFIRRAEVSS